MSTYVMSDIHGCYSLMMRMLGVIGFSDEDELILDGDYIDRGPENVQMLDFISHPPVNVKPVRGNHDDLFMQTVDAMQWVWEDLSFDLDRSLGRDARAMYDMAEKACARAGIVFDPYGLVHQMVFDMGLGYDRLAGWADVIRQLPYYVERHVGGKDYIIVHAGYISDLRDVPEAFYRRRSMKLAEGIHPRPEDFYMYAREEGHQYGGKEHAVIIAGHTPTVMENRWVYTGGTVYRYYDPVKDCTFYDIDCGCCLRRRVPGAALACMRLGDEAVTYLR